MAKYAINDTTLTDIADAIREKTKGTESILVSDFAVAISNISGGGANIDVTYSSILPATVTNGKIVVITSKAAPTTYFGYSYPSGPVNGDVWVHTVDTARGYAFSVGTITLKPGMTMQYNGSKWEYRDAYIGVNGVWQLFSTLSPLGSLSWGQISGLTGSDEDLSRFFQIGDIKSVEIAGDATYDFEIIGMKHDDLADGSGKAGLTFGMKDCLSATYKLNADSDRVGWNGCGFRSTLQNTIFKQLPSDLQAAIKTVSKYASNQSSSSNTLTAIPSLDTLFLFSEIELFGAHPRSVPGEGAVYPRFTDNASRIKKIGTEPAEWWTRSAQKSTSSSNFVYALTTGAGTSSTAAYVLRGIAFGFCV